MVSVLVGCNVGSTCAVDEVGECVRVLMVGGGLVCTLSHPTASKEIAVSNRVVGRIKECGVRIGVWCILVVYIKIM